MAPTMEEIRPEDDTGWLACLVKSKPKQFPISLKQRTIADACEWVVRGPRNGLEPVFVDGELTVNVIIEDGVVARFLLNNEELASSAARSLMDSVLRSNFPAFFLALVKDIEWQHAGTECAVLEVCDFFKSIK